MPDVLSLVLGLAIYGVPAVVFGRVVRRPGMARGRALALTAVAGAAMGALAGGLAAAKADDSELAVVLPFVSFGLAAGLVVGGLGLLARGLGGWLSGRP